MKPFAGGMILFWALVFAGCVSVNSQRYADRRAALEKLETDEELLECVMTGRYDDIREDAVHLIRSDDALIQIVLSRKSGVGSRLKEEAARKIADDELRVRVILECTDLDERTRDGIARKFYTEVARAKVASRKCVSREVAVELAHEVTDQKLLEGIATSVGAYEEVRIAAVRRLVKSEALGGIVLAREAPMRLREVAAGRLVDMGGDCTKIFLALEDLILASRIVKAVQEKERPEVQKKLLELFSTLSEEDLLLDVFNALDRNAVLDKKDTQEKIVRLLVQYDSPELRRKAKIQLLDVEALGRLVMSCEFSNPNLAAWGLERIWGDTALIRVLRSLKTTYAIAKAISLVREESQLEMIAVDGRFSDRVRIASIGRLSMLNADLLRKLALTDSIVVSRAARDRLSVLEKEQASELDVQYEEARKVREKIARDEDVRRTKEFMAKEALRLEMEEQLRNCRSWAQITKTYGVNERQTFRFKGMMLNDAQPWCESIVLSVGGKTETVRVTVRLKTPSGTSFLKGRPVEVVGDFESFEADMVVLRDGVLK